MSGVQGHMRLWHRRWWQGSRKKEVKAGLCFQATLVLTNVKLAETCQPAPKEKERERCEGTWPGSQSEKAQALRLD